jgi:hypothetical protein
VNPVSLASDRVSGAPAPAEFEQVAAFEQVAGALGWAGTPLSGVRLLDTELTVVVEPEQVIAGVLVPVNGSWRQALSIARTCLAFAPVALVLPEAPSELCLLECGYADVGVVVAGSVVLPARPRRPARTTQRRLVDRALSDQLERTLRRSSSGRAQRTR